MCACTYLSPNIGTGWFCQFNRDEHHRLTARSGVAAGACFAERRRAGTVPFLLFAGNGNYHFIGVSDEMMPPVGPG